LLNLFEGLPFTIVFEGTSILIYIFAAINTLDPISMPPTITAPVPIHTLSPITGTPLDVYFGETGPLISAQAGPMKALSIVCKYLF